MGLFGWLFGSNEAAGSSVPEVSVPDINPANGLPMVENTHVDVAGNIYGTDSSFGDVGMDDHWSGGGFDHSGGFDSGFGGGGFD